MGQAETRVRQGFRTVMQKLARLLRSAIVGAGIVYLMVLAILFFTQRSMLYIRTTERPMLNIATLEPKREIVCLNTPDGLPLRAWYFRASQAGAPVVLYLHGNAGDIGNHIPWAKFLIDAGYGVLALEYRGYGGNPGSPSEAGLYDDARGAFAFLKQQGIGDRNVVLFGESLGTGVAVQMATEHDIGAMILRSPYTSIADVAADQLWYFPVRWLVRDRFDSLSNIADIRAPLMIFHGDGDTLIPMTLGRRLFDAAPEPKTWLAVSGTGHNDVQTRAAEHAVLVFLRQAVPVVPGVPAPIPLPSMADCGA
jgi:fermentation-respiration switch protein FrsA (DUF1100 family)